jgi:predicted NBD/HSP70 family sugar kinase
MSPKEPWAASNSPALLRSPGIEGTWAVSILRSVHSSPGITRAQLARRLGISSGLAAETVARLRDRRLVEEVAAPGTGRRGRPTRSLVAHPEGPVVAVVAISHEQWELCVIGLGAAMLAAERRRHDRRWSSVRQVLRGRLRILHRHLGSRVVAVCVSVPGTVSGERLVQASMLGWNDVELSALRPAGVTWPTLAGNDASFSALGEARRGTTRGAQSILHLHMDNGIGGALIDVGRLLAGAHGMAGEFGHMPFGRPSRHCRCGADGCWNTALDGAALADQLGRAVVDEVSFSAEVFARAVERPGPERRAAHGAARSLGRGIAALVNAHDPEMVCLTGLAPALRAVAPDMVTDAYQRGLMSSRAIAPPPLLDGSLGTRAAAIGAAEQAFDRLLSDPLLERWNEP